MAAPRTPPVPTDNPELPSFLHPSHRARAASWEVVGDIYQGRSAWFNPVDGITNRTKAARYLPREYKEKDGNYLNRLRRKSFDNFLKPAINGFAGLLSDITLNDDVLPSLAASESNIDLAGNDLVTFFAECDRDAMRDGAVAILVEHAPELVDLMGLPLIRTALDQQRFGLNLRPYLVKVLVTDILNWDLEIVDGAPVIHQVTIVQSNLVRTGRFGTTLETTYNVLSPGLVETYRIDYDDRGRTWTAVLIMEAETSLDFVPLVYYSTVETSIFEAEPPFQDLAELNIDHYQISSEHRELLHGCNLPVWVRKGLIQPGATAEEYRELPQLTIGPGSLVDVPSDGDLVVAEPSGASAGSNRQEKLDTEQAMQRRTLDFLSGEATDKTATQVVRESAQTESSIALMARQKESALQTVFKYWATYLAPVGSTGVGSPSLGGTATVNKTLLQVPLDAQMVGAVSALIAAGQITRETGLKILQLGKLLPRDVKVSEEAAALPLPLLDQQGQVVQAQTLIGATNANGRSGN